MIANIIWRYNLSKLKNYVFLTLLLIVSQVNVSAQSIPIHDLEEEQIRLIQMMKGVQYTSFTNRPIWNDIYSEYLKIAEPGNGIWSRNNSTKDYDISSEMNIRFGFYRPTVRIAGNSTVPYSENNESAWYGSGLNTEFTGGFWLSSDYVTLTFRPQIVSQQNLDFEVPRFIPDDSEGNLRFVAEGIGDIIDQPFRFGSDSFNTFSYGYTSLRIHYKTIETGISNEPILWGANVKYPLLMSNNAPGMEHFFVGTRRPINIPWFGKLEFKWLGAFPEDSDYFDQEEAFKRDRFLTGINIVYSPAISPNLQLGFARVVHTYIDSDGLKSSDLGMIFDPFYLKEFIDTRGPLRDVKPRNHLNSLFARWVWPGSKTEIFAEYLRDDFAWDSRDLLMEPQHNSGYSIGFSKLFEAPLAKFYKITFEQTDLTPSFLEEVRPQNYYYSDTKIKQGHTNKGQLLGAAIGPGSNSQFVGLDAYQTWGRIGVFVQRLSDNNHFHFEFDRSLNRPEEFRQGYGDYWRHRTDLIIGVKSLYHFKKIWISSEFSWKKLFNYGRFDYGEFGGLNIANFEPYDKRNIHFKLSFSYNF